MKVGDRVEHNDGWEGEIISISDTTAIVLWKLTDDDDGIEYVVNIEDLEVVQG